MRVSMRAQVAITDAPIPPDRRFAPLLGPLPDLVRDLRRMRDLGVDHVALWPAGRDEDLDTYLAHMERFASDLIPAVGDEA